MSGWDDDYEGILPNGFCDKIVSDNSGVSKTQSVIARSEATQLLWHSDLGQSYLDCWFIYTAARKER